MSYSPLIISFTVALLFIVGCSSSDESSREWASTSPDTTTHQKRNSFETHTDTVTTRGSTQRNEPTPSSDPVAIRYMVQIGSYRDKDNASAMQSLARQRYQLPVVNDYNAARRLYQVRIGFFETEEAANAFRLKLIADQPADYKKAWIVQIAK